jgi:hypothetical protein
MKGPKGPQWKTKRRTARGLSALAILCYFLITHLDYTINEPNGETIVHAPHEVTIHAKKHEMATFKPALSPAWSIPNAIPNSTSEQFMKELAAFKHELNIPLPWEKNASSIQLPTPIFVVNLPKSGTTTLHQYFDCGKIPSSHTVTKKSNGEGNIRIARCLRINHAKERNNTPTPPLHGCDGYSAYSDIGDAAMVNGLCYYPSLHIDGLEYLARYYPNATIVLATRSAKSWYQSIKKWHNGNMIDMWRDWCGFPGYLIDGTEEERWTYFYQAHTQKIRDFVVENLGLTYIESELENGHLLGRYTGIDSSCWMDCKPRGGCAKLNVSGTVN